MNNSTVLEASFTDLNNISQTNMVELVIEKLKQLILSERLPAGYCFPNENEMCRIIGIGRTTLREAYKVLETNGYISRSKRGTVVNNDEEVLLHLPLSTAIGLSDFNDLIEFRAIFESQLAALAAERASNEQIFALRKLVEKMERNQNDMEKISYYDTQFHMTMAAASQNKLMHRIMIMSYDVFASGVYKAFGVDTPLNIQQAINSHKQILSAVEQRDSKSAKQAMFDHISNIRQRGI